MLNYTLGIEENVNKIFAGVLIGGLSKDNVEKDRIISATKSNKNRFIGNFPSNIFQNEFAIFYDIIVNLNVTVFNTNDLDTIIDNNRDLVLDSPFVDISKFNKTANDTQATDDEKIEAVKANLRDKLLELSNVYVGEDEFDSACSIFTNWFKNQYMLQTAQAMTLIMSDQGYDEKKPGKRMKHYTGFEDTRDYYTEKLKILNELSDSNRVRTMVVDSDWFEKEMQDEESTADVNALMTLGIPEIDNTVGELRRGNMLGVLGPPKGGKTRFVNFIANRALTLGLNVAVWSLEGSKEEWLANQVALLIRRESNLSFNSKDILQRKYVANAKDKEIVVGAKLKLANDQGMGRLSFIETTAYIEDFKDILKAHYENDNPFDVIIIDQLIDIMSRTGMAKVPRISQAYIELKQFIQTGLKRPVLAVIPAQLKQATIDYLRKNPEDTIDVTAGGESAETIRSPDDVVGLFSSKEERLSNMMHIYSVASRHSESFPDFRVRADLRCCYFESDPSLN